MATPQWVAVARSKLKRTDQTTQNIKPHRGNETTATENWPKATENQGFLDVESPPPSRSYSGNILLSQRALPPLIADHFFVVEKFDRLLFTHSQKIRLATTNKNVVVVVRILRCVGVVDVSTMALECVHFQMKKQ